MKRLLSALLVFLGIFSASGSAFTGQARAEKPAQTPSVTISADPGGFTGFSNVSTTSTRVLATGQVVINLNATALEGFNAASLRVYTENPAQQNGMVGQSTATQTVPFKVWTPNFGPGIDDDFDGIPDVTLDNNWNDPAQAVWAYVLDKSQPAPEAEFPWNTPLFNYTDLFRWSDNSSDPNLQLPSFLYIINEPLYFALVLEGKASPQVYSTTVYVEFALSTDFGNTVSDTYRTSFPLTVTVQDAAPVVTLNVDSAQFGGFSNLPYWPGRMTATGVITLTPAAYGLYPYDAASLRVYTINSSSQPGLVGTQYPTATVPLKVWTPNYGYGIDGNGDGIPDVANDTNWKDPVQGVWVNVLDWSTPVTETWWSALPPSDPYYDPQCAWCYHLFSYTDLFKWSDYHDRLDVNGDYVYHLPNTLAMEDRRPVGGTDNRIPLYLAADFTDALPQTYTTTLYIEYAFSNDKGQTVTQQAAVPVTVSAAVPGDGSAVNWLANRVAMRPDMDGTAGTVKKLADSYQDPGDGADGGWTYDQALAVIALTAGGRTTEAKQVLEGLQYLQNSDGSWFFSYLTTADDAQVQTWASTDETTLYLSGEDCNPAPVAGANGYPDALETRVCWDKTHTLPNGQPLPIDQMGPWLLQDYSAAPSPETGTLLPDKIKYRVYDFRKFTGTNAWVVMAIAYYEMQTGDDSYRQMAQKAMQWLENQRQKNAASPAYGGLAIGRVWYGSQIANGVYGFTDDALYVAEHNFDGYAAYQAMARITENTFYTNAAALIQSFALRELWDPNIVRANHPELPPTARNLFYPGLRLSDPAKPFGEVDTCVYLDGQTWSVLSFGPSLPVKASDGSVRTLAIALDYPNTAMRNTNATIFAGTGFQVTGIDGYKENDCNSTPNDGGLVWSEGSEGMVAARYLSGNTAEGDTYHAETRAYQLSNGGVPYSTYPPQPGNLTWQWSDTNSIGGTAWFYFNDASPRVNPFQPWANGMLHSSNLVANPEFDNGAANWSLAEWGTASGNTWQVVTGAGLSGDNAAQVTFSNPGGADWHVQLRQPFPINSNKTYQISFMARAGSPRTLRLLIQQENDPWTVYWEQTVNLTNAPTTFGPYTFTSTTDDLTTLLNFNVGGDPTLVYIDNVVITAPDGDRIFADSFETGSLASWSGSTTDGGDLSVSALAALAGSGGLQAVIDNNTAIYVTDQTPQAETRYRARFYFDPNSITMASGNSHFLLYGMTGTSTVVVRLEFRSYQGNYQVRASLINDASAWAYTGWVTIQDERHFFEIDWRAATAAGGNDGGLTLGVDGDQKANLTGVDNDTRRVDFVRFGAVAGIDTGTRGAYYFDAFDSHRQNYIGPDPSAPALPPPPPAPDDIFADGFESGNLSAWSASATDAGDLSASSAAALSGAYGLQATLDDNKVIYVTDWTPFDESHYRARFYFDPNSITMASGDAHNIFYGYVGSSKTVVVGIQFRYYLGSYQHQAFLVRDNGSWVYTGWQTVSDGPHALEIDWRAATAAGGNDGGLTFWIDGVQQANLTGIDNDTRRVDYVRLGAVAGIDPGTRGVYFFDVFESRRATYIGP